MCANRVELACNGGVVEGNTETDGTNCQGGTSPEIVYRFVLDTVSDVRINTCHAATDFDTLLRVYSTNDLGQPEIEVHGEACFGGNMMVANDDETCHFASTSSKAILSALQPGEYTVLVEGAAIGTGDTSGTFGIELGCHPIGTAPTPQPTLVPTQRQSGTPRPTASDECDHLDELCHEHELQCSETVVATPAQDGHSCVGNDLLPESSYHLHLDEDTNVVLTTCDSRTNMQSHVNVFAGCYEDLVLESHAQHGPHDTCTSTAYSNTADGLLAAGDYTVVVEAAFDDVAIGHDSVAVTLACEEVGGVCADGTDYYPVCYAHPIRCGVVMSGSTEDSGTSCWGSESPEVYYSFSLDEYTDVTLTTCLPDAGETNFDTILRLYSDCDEDALIVTNDDASCPGGSPTAATISIGLDPGMYVVVVEGYAANKGEFMFGFECSTSGGEPVPTPTPQPTDDRPPQYQFAVTDDLGGFRGADTMSVTGMTAGAPSGNVPVFEASAGAAACSACSSSGTTSSGQSTYKFTLEEGHTGFAASTCNEVTGFDTVLFLHDHDGRPVAVSDDMGCTDRERMYGGKCRNELCDNPLLCDDVSSGLSHIWCSSCAAGDYYITVAGFGTAEGMYQLDIAVGGAATPGPIVVTSRAPTPAPSPGEYTAKTPAPSVADGGGAGQPLAAGLHALLALGVVGLAAACGLVVLCACCCYCVCRRCCGSGGGAVAKPGGAAPQQASANPYQTVGLSDEGDWGQEGRFDGAKDVEMVSTLRRPSLAPATTVIRAGGGDTFSGVV